MRNSAFLAVVFIFLAFPVFAQNATEGALFAVNRKGDRASGPTIELVLPLVGGQ